MSEEAAVPPPEAEVPAEPVANAAPSGLSLVSRATWGAAEPSEKDALTTPVANIICTYTGTPPCQSPEDCQKKVKELQTYHMESQRMPDIQYNFLVGGDGNVYEGRGWTTYAPPALKGKRYNGLNYKSINVALIGDFKDADPPENMVAARKDLIDFGKENNFIDSKTAAMWHGF